MSNNNDTKQSWLAGLLTGWGIKESWAKIIAGAVIGALAAAGVLTTQTSCSAGMSLTYKSDKGELTWRLEGKDGENGEGGEERSSSVPEVPEVIEQKK